MILLDTHVLLWWLENDKHLSLRARSVIEQERKSGEIAVSSISVWEICMLIKGGRLNLARDIETWINDLEAVPFLQITPVNHQMMQSAVFLPEPFHKDPADRIIVATALRLGVPLVTGDAKIRGYRHVRTVW
ncbi:type II toxin-antitoxin system VapC family toxin [Candidatus Gottesmanbacteria bacterium]|nr:type II toxin-antitoxin system VapC family toxin [Candidatus Gottesmanbacteria bacterium]